MVLMKVEIVIFVKGTMMTLLVSTGTGAESMGGRGSRGKWGSAPMDLHSTDRQYLKKKLFSVESFDCGCWGCFNVGFKDKASFWLCSRGN